MTNYISADLRRFVEARANHLCEYCLLHADDTYLGCQIDHVIAEKHGGPTEVENLCLACAICNRAKGSDIGSIAPSTGEFSRFYNPRIDRWTEHFALKGVAIQPRTPTGEATAKILGLNLPDRLLEREMLQSNGSYPPNAAKALLLRES